MTRADNYSPIRIQGNGSTTVFSGSWLLNAQTDVIVSLRAVADENDETVQTITTHYTVAFDGSGFSVTFVTAPSSLYYVVLTRATPITQPISYSTAVGFQGITQETSYDRLTSMVQENSEAIERAPKFVAGGGTSNLNFPSPSANKLIGWNTAGTALQNTGTPAFSENVIFFDKVADMLSYGSSFTTGQYAATHGYTIAGDGGANIYIVRSSGSRPTEDGGKYIYDPASATQYFEGLFPDGRYSVEQWGAGSDPDAAFIAATAFAKRLNMQDASYTIDPDTTLADGASLEGNGNTTLSFTSDAQTDYGLECLSDNLIKGVTVNHVCNTSSIPNSRSNSAIYSGSQGSAGSGVYKNVTIEDVVVSRSGTTANISNAIQFFNDSSYTTLKNVLLSGTFLTGIQYHWNYNSGSTETNHPRNIIQENITIDESTGNLANLYYFSGAHMAHCRNLHGRNGKRFCVIGAGDEGEMLGAADISHNRVLSEIFIQNTSAYNTTNEGFQINGSSYLEDAGTDNTTWNMIDAPAPGIVIDGHYNLKGAASTNNETINAINAKNISARQIITGLLNNSSQATDANAAIFLDGIVNSDFQSKSNCVVAADVRSGHNIKLDVYHRNSDTANSLSQNGVVLVGSIESATVSANVSINDTSITLDEIPCTIHAGMRFYDASGNEFVFRSSHDFNGTAAYNQDLTFDIDPAPAALSATDTISIAYSPRNMKITGFIDGMNKGIRLNGDDPRHFQNVEIDAVIENSFARDVEVVGGAQFKYNGAQWKDNGTATVGIVSGAPTTTTVVRWMDVGGTQLGVASAVPSSGTWRRGAFIHNEAATASSQRLLGWQCISAGTPGTWRAIYMADVDSSGNMTVSGDLTLSASDIITDTTTGTKIATGATQKLGFWGATPAVQQAAIADASGGATVDAEARAAINDLLAKLRTLGIIAT